MVEGKCLSCQPPLPLPDTDPTSQGPLHWVPITREFLSLAWMLPAPLAPAHSRRAHPTLLSLSGDTPKAPSRPGSSPTQRLCAPLSPLTHPPIPNLACSWEAQGLVPDQQEEGPRNPGQQPVEGGSLGLNKEAKTTIPSLLEKKPKKGSWGEPNPK